MKRALMILAFAVIAFGCFAQITTHPNFVTFTETSPTTGTVRWSAEPAANVDYYYIGVHPNTTTYTAPAYCDPDWNQPGGPVASFTLDAPGVYKLDVVGLNPTLDYYAYVAAVETGGWTWSAYSSWEPPITLPAVSDLTIAKLSPTSLRLNWTYPFSMYSYKVYCDTDPNGTFDTVAGTPSTNFFTDTISSTNTKYFYKVVAEGNLP